VPFTHFHLGPGVALKAIWPRQVSLLVFALCQLLIDLEPLYSVLHNEYPLHRFFHTLPGATLIAMVGVFLGRYLGEFWLRLYNRKIAVLLTRPIIFSEHITWRMAVVGALLGVSTHLFFDGMMHSDFNPLAPWSPWVGLQGVLTGGQIYQVCLLLGGLGVVVILVRWWRG